MKSTVAKRIVSFLSAAVIGGCSIVLTSCSNESEDRSVSLDPDNPTTISIWHYYNGPQKTAFDRLVTEFNETVGMERGVIVESFSQGSVSELIEKVLDSANNKVGADEIPDVFAAYADTAYQVDQLGLVADIGQYLTQEELDSYIAGYIEEGRFDKEQTLKIFPIAKSTEIMMINKTDWDKFSQATGAGLGSLATMEGLTATAQQYYEWTDSLTSAPDDGKAFFGRDAMANYFIIGSKQLGTEIFEVKGGSVTINCDETVMRTLWDNYYVPIINGYFGAYGRFRSDDAKTGDIIALVGSTSGAAYFPDKVTVNDTESYPIDIIAMEPPVFEGGEKIAVQQGAGMVVTKSTKEKEYASTLFLKWFTEKDRSMNFSISSGYLPVRKDANDSELLEAELQKLTDDGVANNLSVSLPIALQMLETYTMYTNKAFENGTDARSILENSMSDLAQSDLKKIQVMVASGMNKADAVAQFDTEKNFQQWYQSIKESLLALAE